MQLSHCVGVLLLSVHYGLASFCGDSAIPFSFEALPDGQPVLGCSRPACFGWSAAGQPFSDKFSFYTVNGHPDGFFQPLYHAISPFQPGDGSHYPEQFARCDDTYRSNSCDDSTQWVGGIAPVLNASGYPLVLQCCTYDPLRYSTDRGIATIHTGEIFAGGEVTKNNQTYAFDYISNVERKVDESGRIFYEVNVKRLPCSGDARISPIPEDMASAIRDLNSQSLGKAGPALGAPNLNNVNALPLPGGGQYASGGPQPLPFPQSNSYSQPAPAPLPPVNSYAGAAIPQYGTSISGGNYAQPANQFMQYVAPNSYAAPPMNAYAQAPQQSWGAGPSCSASCAPAQPSCNPCAAGGGGAGSYFCFTADTLVETISGEKKRMDELEINDFVLTVRGNNVGYSPVNYWLHRVPSQKAEFIKFDLADGKSLKITAKHFIYKGKCTGNMDAAKVNQGPVLAEEVEVGDCLYARDGNYLMEQEVISKQVVTEVGIYAPMTSNAKIIVNDVLASCNNVYESQSLTNTFFSNIESMRQTLASIFDYSLDSSETDLPFGTHTIMQMAEIVLPKNIMTL